MNWGQIKQTIREYTHRSDLSDELLAAFLELAHQRIHFGESNTPKLRHSSMVHKATLYFNTQPSDYLEAIKVFPQGEPDRPVEYVPLASMPKATNAFSWAGQSLVLSDELAFPVEIVYYARLADLVADTDCNWLTDNAPSVYITAIGVEVGDWMKDQAFASAQAAKYASACASLMSSDRAASISGSPLVMRRKR